MNPPLAEGIRRAGFRKWYERELIFSHVYLALALLALAGMLGAIEVFADATLAEKLLDVAFVLICAVVTFYAVRAYLLALAAAESVAHQATCANCSAYGRIEVQSEDRREARVDVRCKRCGHAWSIHAPEW